MIGGEWTRKTTKASVWSTDIWRAGLLDNPESDIAGKLSVSYADLGSSNRLITTQARTDMAGTRFC